MSILQTNDLKKYYGTEPNITRALDGVTFSVEEGEFVAVVGTSGSGKSTLLHMMGGLDTPTSGSVVVRDKELAKMNDEQLTIFRRRNIGFVFQNYNLVPILNVHENIVLPVELAFRTNSRICPTTFPAASSSAWRLPAPWYPNRPLSWLMNPLATWTARPAPTCWACFSAPAGSSTKRL